MTKEYVFNIKPNYNIIFHRGNTQIGVLDFNGPEMTFSGDMDKSAILFIEVIANSFKARLEQERVEEREACAKFIEHDYVRQFERPWRVDLSAAIRARGQA